MITDVDGVRVGHTTLWDGDDIRTGVTVVVPPRLPCFAGCHTLNGNGEVTGLEWLRESGFLTSPIGLTNTHSVGVVRDALVAWEIRSGADRWHLPVVGETFDGFLNDINGMHVKTEHVFSALESAAGGEVEQGCVGSGTGMICHGFKGGIGTASEHAGEWTVGVLVQANHGRRARLRIDGVPVGEELGPDVVPMPGGPEGAGSIIVVVATDAPLLPHQCRKLAQRAELGIGRTGGAGEDSSGDFMLAFSTTATESPVTYLANETLNDLYYATIEATERAIVNALLHAKTTASREGRVVHALPRERLEAIMRKYGR